MLLALDLEDEILDDGNRPELETHDDASVDDQIPLVALNLLVVLQELIDDLVSSLGVLHQSDLQEEVVLDLEVLLVLESAELGQHNGVHDCFFF